MNLYLNYTPLNQQQWLQHILSFIRSDFSQKRREDIASQLLAIDWFCIARFADRQRILPILYYNLKKTGLVESLPSSVRNFFRVKYMSITGNNMRLAERLVNIIKLFEKNKIPVVPFKGPVLAEAIYGDSTLRYYQDLDILVPRKEAFNAWNLLQEAGYRQNKIQITRNQFKGYATHKNEFDFIDDRGRIAVDLHWKFINHIRYSYDFDFCKQRLARTSFHDKNVYRLSGEDTVLSLCLHGSGSAWGHLEMILCLAEYITMQPGLDWQLILALAGYLHCERMLLLGLFLVQDLFDTDIPSDVYGKIARDTEIPKLAATIYKNLFQEKQEGSHIDRQLANLPYQFGLRKQPVDKLRYALGRIFSPKENDWQAIRLGPGLIYLYFLIRPVRQGIKLLQSKIENK